MRGRLQLLLHAFDDGWSHRLESLTAALQGVTETEAAWQQTCYRADEGWPGMPPPAPFCGRSLIWSTARATTTTCSSIAPSQYSRRRLRPQQLTSPGLVRGRSTRCRPTEPAMRNCSCVRLLVSSRHTRATSPVTAGSCCSGAVRRLRRSRGEAVWTGLTECRIGAGCFQQAAGAI